MIIYNVTLNIDNTIHQKWLEWMKDKHIPKVLGTGKFKKAVFSQVMVDDDGESKTYSVQYFAESRETLDSYYTHEAPALRQEGLELFSDKMLAFRTELEVVDEYFVHQNN